MFDSINYLKAGNAKQKLAYKALTSLNIMRDLSEFTPVLCGTIPIEIDIDGSDLDIITEVFDHNSFEALLREKYGVLDKFILSRSIVRGVNTITANFLFEGFEIEIFGQAIPVKEQNAYLHMIIEHSIMKKDPNIKEAVINLKKQGFKTEPAFCKVLGLTGDPYDELLKYGYVNGLICK